MSTGSRLMLICVLFAMSMPLHHIHANTRTNTLTSIDAVNQAQDVVISAISVNTNIAENLNLDQMVSVQGVPLDIISNVTDLVEINGVPSILVNDIARLSYETSVPAEEIINDVKLALSYGIPLELTIDVVRLARVDGLDLTYVVTSVKLALEYGIDQSSAIKIAKIAYASGIDLDTLRDFMVMIKLSSVYSSRFDIIEPHIFSRMWVIKHKALEAEKAGQNTDALYKLYVEMLQVMIDEESKEDE